MKKDTTAWVLQTWIFFAIALTFSTYGIFSLNIDGWVRGFMLFGVFSTLSSSFTLSKTIRDNKEKQVDTNIWIMQTWLVFAISIVMTGIGLYSFEATDSIKGFISVSFLFALSCAFTLAKTIRDNQDVDTTVVKDSKVF